MGAIDRFKADPIRGRSVSESEDFAAVLDSLIVCKFLRKCFNDFYPEAADLLSGVTGWDCSAVEIKRTGARIHTMKKLFNIREGWQSRDDWLPERLLSETLSTGVGAGIGLSPDELREMIQSAEKTIQGAKAMLLQIEGKKKLVRKKKTLNEEAGDGKIIKALLTDK